MGLSSPIAISGSMPVSVGGTGGGTGGLGSLVRAAGSAVLPAIETIANTGAAGAPAYFLSKGIRAFLDSRSSPEASTAPVETSAPTGAALVAAMAKGAPKEQVTVGDLINIVNARAASGDTNTTTTLANLVRNAKADARASDNAADNAAIAREKAAAMNVLYGGAGSSFESGRDEYTESGQYDIDQAKRHAEFDAMRAARGESVKRTPAETARMLADLQSRIGFGGVMSPANAPMSTIPARVSPPDVDYELASGFNVPKPRTTVAANNQGIAPFMGVPMRGRGRGGGARK